MSSNSQPTIDSLLRILPVPVASPDNKSGPEVLLHTQLPAHPTLAGAADANGYTLLHASASYASDKLKDSHKLLRALVRDYHVDVNIRDAEGDTPLHFAERPETARLLVEELGADWRRENSEGATAEDYAQMNAEDEEGTVAESWRQVAQYLRSLRTGAAQSGPSTNAEATGTTTALGHPPPLPPGMSIDIGAVRNEDAVDGQDAPDPEFRARIEALAARPDFQGEQGQAELRRLVEDAIGGLQPDAAGESAKRGKIR